MTPLGLVAMRKAAALAFAIPGLEVEIIHDGHVVARIERRFDASNAPLSSTLLSPCAFRASVGRVTEHAKSGGSVVFLGLDPQAELALRYSMPFAGAAQPLGMLVSRVGEAVVHVFATQATLLSADVAIHRLRHCVDLPEPLTINTAWDPVTEITLVYCESHIAQHTLARPLIEMAMWSLNFDLGVEEIVRAMAPEPSRPDGPS